jgi:hypothetical protein
VLIVHCSALQCRADVSLCCKLNAAAVPAAVSHTRKHLVRGLLTAAKGYNCLLVGAKAEIVVVNVSIKTTSEFCIVIVTTTV